MAKKKTVHRGWITVDEGGKPVLTPFRDLIVHNRRREAVKAGHTTVLACIVIDSMVVASTTRKADR